MSCSFYLQKFLNNYYFCSFTAPTAYQTEKVNLNHTPAYTFGIKVKHEKYSDTPGTNFP